MSVYIMINDIHLSDRAPASCTDTYLDDLFDLLKQVSRLADADEAEAIILAGDVFHHKTPGRTSHQTVMRLIDWARNSLTPVYAVAGNHDLSHDRVASLLESQPLGVVIASNAIELLDGWMDLTDDHVYGVPWQMSFDHDSVYEALAEYRDYHDLGSRPGLVVTHAPLYPPGMELKFEYFPAQVWADAMGNQGTVHYGHVHEPHGVYEVGGVTFSNCGALSRGSLHEHNLNRTPHAAVWDSETGRITHHMLEAKPAEQVFKLAEAMVKKDAAADLSDFLAGVQATRLDISSTDSVLAYVRATQQNPALIKLIESFIEQVNS